MHHLYRVLRRFSEKNQVLKLFCQKNTNMQTRKIKTGAMIWSGSSKLNRRKRHYFWTDLKIKACNKSIRSIQRRCGQFVGELKRGSNRRSMSLVCGAEFLIGNLG